MIAVAALPLRATSLLLCLVLIHKAKGKPSILRDLFEHNSSATEDRCGNMATENESEDDVNADGNRFSW